MTTAGILLNRLPRIGTNLEKMATLGLVGIFSATAAAAYVYAYQCLAQLQSLDIEMLVTAVAGP